MIFFPRSKRSRPYRSTGLAAECCFRRRGVNSATRWHITAALIDASRPLSISQLRPLCRVRKATLCERLTAMTTAGQLHRDAEGYRIAVKP
jgi:hypothetical protein